MPKFEVAGLAEPLEYDFTAAGVDAKGTIPEPSDAMIGKYLSDVKAAFMKLGQVANFAALDTEDPAAMMKALENVDPAEFVSVLDEVSKAAASLCGGKPSLAQIRKLPLRVRRHFFAYLQEEIVNPEAAPGGGSAAAS